MDIEKAATAACLSLLSEKSKQIYEDAYKSFKECVIKEVR